MELSFFLIGLYFFDSAISKYNNKLDDFITNWDYCILIHFAAHSSRVHLQIWRRNYFWFNIAICFNLINNTFNDFF